MAWSVCVCVVLCLETWCDNRREHVFMYVFTSIAMYTKHVYEAAIC